MRHPGQVNANIVNRKRFRVNNIKESLKEAVNIMLGEDRISHRYIVILVDNDYRGMLNSGLAIAMRMSQREYMDCCFVVCVLESATIDLQGELLHFLKVENVTEIGDKLINLCF